jgi:hypothetical protein
MLSCVVVMFAMVVTLVVMAVMMVVMFLGVVAVTSVGAFDTLECPALCHQCKREDARNEAAHLHHWLRLADGAANAYFS